MEAESTPRLTRRLLAQARVIAKGKRIRDIRRLFDRYGGRPSKWGKKSSPMFEVAGEQFEYHWYEHPGIGKVEVKQTLVHRQ